MDNIDLVRIAGFGHQRVITLAAVPAHGFALVSPTLNSHQFGPTPDGISRSPATCRFKSYANPTNADYFPAAMATEGWNACS